jgi:uncharacterized protein (DUF1800 family)
MLSDPKRAWEPFVPCASAPWDLPRVAHLQRRAGFAAPWPVLERDVREGPEASINRLLQGEPKSGDGSIPAEFERLLDEMARNAGFGGNLGISQGIWLYRMIFTPHPLRERLTLFWHNHFATSQTKVQDLPLMQRQIDLLRTHALGDFKALLQSIGKDPAMLVWLDSTSNRKAKPNENYAREVMELFTLGRGHYTEKDIQEAARAFTGWFVVGGSFREMPAQHDGGAKTIFGRSGPFEGDDVARILLEQPACALFLCRKLFRQFVSDVDEPSDALLEPLAAALRGASYDIRVPVETILRSRLFHDDSMRRRRIKSPVEFAVGLVRSLEILKPTVSAEALAQTCARMGQALLAPPSVAGWEGGPAWINTTTTVERTNLVLGLLSSSDGSFGNRLNARALAERHGFSASAELARFYVDLSVQDAFGDALRARVARAAEGSDRMAAAREAATLVLTSPEYQLA